jgi:thiamine biosynthesis protein ThiS
MQQLKVNGRNVELSAPQALPELVASILGHHDRRGVAVGLNGIVVPRADWDEVVVKDGDEVEIVTPFVGG